MGCKWEAGKTYKTTRDGITAKILVVDATGDYYGNLYGGIICSNYWHQDGSDYNGQRGANLLPELAEEPQVEPSPRFTVVRRGEKWGVSDSQRPGMHAPFRTHTSACWACDEMTDVGGDNGYGFVDDKPSESDIEAVLSDPVVSDDGSDEPQPVDVINNPPHYNQGDIECIDAIQAALSPEEFRGHLRACALKYLWRCNHKGGREDLLKAEWYLKRLNREMIRGECVSHGGNGCETEGGET